MDQRCEEVAEAYQQTFRWIFLPDTENQPWDNFVQWLQSRTGIYWINGKAGSGKSTLMRYICNSPATRRELKAHWAGETPFSTPGFFFWNSGTIEQRSQASLLRSLLYETLHDDQTLIPIVLPWLYARSYTQALCPVANYEHAELPVSKLSEAFKILLEQT